MSLKERINILFDKIDNYIKDTPNRRERKFEKKMLRDSRKLETLQLQTDLELEKSEIAKQRNGRELIRLKVRQEREKARPKNKDMPMPFSMAQGLKRSKKEKPLPIGLKF